MVAIIAIRLGKLSDCQLSTMSSFQYLSTFKQLSVHSPRATHESVCITLQMQWIFTEEP